MRWFIFVAALFPFLSHADDETAKCEAVGKEVVQVTKGATSVTNIQPLVTWRASCAEKPPVGKGTIYALCDADLISQNGATRRIFYWSKNLPAGGRKMGYHLCPKSE